MGVDLMRRKLILWIFVFLLCGGSLVFGQSVSQEDYDSLVSENEELQNRVEYLENMVIPVDVQSKIMNNLPKKYEMIIPELVSAQSIKVKYTGKVIQDVPDGVGSLEILINYKNSREEPCELKYEMVGAFEDYYLIGRGDTTETLKNNNEMRLVLSESGDFHYGLLNGKGTSTRNFYSSGVINSVKVWQGEYLSGVKNGIFEETSTYIRSKGNRVYKLEGEYLNGRKEGYWKEEKLSESGKVEEAWEGNFENGYKIGKWLYRNANGDMEIEEYTSVEEHDRLID